jgi:FAD/FMN-containing dehydrogenase
MFPGSNNIINGLTIDLGHMNASWYDARKRLASVEPGGRWRDVYRNLLDTANIMVTGGRDGDVGVGGFLIGGGNSYYSGTNGFGCDTVVNFEVVLANGSIVDANTTSNPDLYKALKGGATNFGIVTRFDMLAMPAVDLAYGQSVISTEYTDDVLGAVADFTDRADERRHDHLITIYTHTPEAEDPVFLAIRVNTKGDLNTKSFKGITNVPALRQNWARISLANAANASQIDAGQK